MKINKFLLATSMCGVLAFNGCTQNNVEKMDFTGYSEDIYADLNELKIGIGETYKLCELIFEQINISTLKVAFDDKNIIDVNENFEVVGKNVGTTNLYIYDDINKIVHTIPTTVLSDADLRKSFKIDKGRFADKKITYFGDSITQYWGNDEYYVKFVSDALKADYYNYGVTSTTAAHSEVRYLLNSITTIGPDYVNNAITNNEIGDYAFILYGTNDWSGYVKMGSIDDYEEDTSKIDTFYGGLNYMVSKIQETNPNTKIIMMSCLFRNMIFDENPNNLGEEHTLEEYNLAIQKIAEKYGTKFIDLWKLFDETTLVRNFNDGLHPNETGHRAITEYILKQ